MGLYPQISLTGNLGTSSTDLLSILANPVARLGAGLVLPFLNFKDGELRVKVSEADYQIAVSEFRAAAAENLHANQCGSGSGSR